MNATGSVRDLWRWGCGHQVIGADSQMLETRVPVRQMLEQMVPPFMLGLHWSAPSG